MNDIPRNSVIPPAAFVLLGVLLWSTGGLFIKMTSVDAFAVNLGRSLLAAATVAIFTYRRGFRPDWFTVFSSFLYAGTLTCFVYANKTTTAANAIFLQYTAPIYILAFAPLVLKEKFRFRDLVTVFFCLAGMALFFIDKKGAETAPNVPLGNVVALISGIFFGLYILAIRHHRSLQKNPAISVLYGNLMVVLVMLPFVSADPPQTLTIKDIVAISFLGIVQIGIAYILFTNGIAAGVRSLDASIIGFIEPLFNPIWVFVFLGETPAGWAVAGGIIILATVAIHTIVNSRHGVRAAS